jgi:hypothetical protein
MTYCTAEEVIQLTGLKPQHLRVDTTAADGGVSELKSIIGTWISQCESLINSYCNTSFDDEDVPGAVENVCLRMASNMVAFSQTRRDTPIVKVDDWKVAITSSAIFTNDLKYDLNPFVVKKDKQLDKVNFFTITGD